MSDPFSQLIPEARAFLTELSQNNARDWFNDHKPRYEAQLKTPALHLLDQIAAQIGDGVTTKLFRPQRDVRFSKDKTPYNTHLHMLWMIPGGRAGTALFFGIGLDYVSVGGGIMGFDKTTLTDWRTSVDGPMGAELADVINALIVKNFRLSEPELKRVPAPYDKEHPHGDLLRRKSLTLWCDLPDTRFDAPTGAITETLNNLRPLFSVLNLAL
ncbi:TIGR02453 family protein [Tropicibacter sp. R16_0]|uniref:TIGR02453 family protein n=1 Tax=Tropicibacter sp. R16_0 TaxID=2821102 RepID=UPI001ADC4501|nr:TIGR02453 family protein [Tropicibacter sp. R16_0]MBO9449970.1 TIGR02453 family protein [Tropicibacter sp. R16_0]